jgi:hypothetical protein
MTCICLEDLWALSCCIKIQRFVSSLLFVAPRFKVCSFSCVLYKLHTYVNGRFVSINLLHQDSKFVGFFVCWKHKWWICSMEDFVNISKFFFLLVLLPTNLFMKCTSSWVMLNFLTIWSWCDQQFTIEVWRLQFDHLTLQNNLGQLENLGKV